VSVTISAIAGAKLSGSGQPGAKECNVSQHRRTNSYRHAIVLALVIGLVSVVVLASRARSGGDTMACREVRQTLSELTRQPPEDDGERTERERFVAAVTARITGESPDCFTARQRDDALTRLRALSLRDAGGAAG
jgi:hypothetical protein